jgi:HJR/Mrr/RecB family endonuclease
MRPDEYEHIVAAHFESKGYSITVSQYSNDYGVDIFAIKGREKNCNNLQKHSNSIVRHSV